MKITEYPLATTIDGTEQTIIDQSGASKRAPLSLLMGSAGGLFYSGFYVSLDAAVAAIGSTPGTLIIHDALPVVANTTVPTTLAVLCTGGADLQVPTGVTATFNGPFDAPLCQVFTLTGTGVVAFGQQAVREFLPEWWGAEGNFTYPNTGTENQASLQACFDAAAAVARTGANFGYPLVKLTAGKNYLTGNVTLAGAVNLDMRGATLEAAVSRGTYLVNQPLLTIDAAHPGAFYWGLAVSNQVFFNSPKFDPQYRETNIGIKFANCNNQHIILGHLFGFYITLQFYGLTSYTTVSGGWFSTFKIGIDLRTGPAGSGYFVNENYFHECNLSATSNTTQYGQVVGVRFSSDDNGQAGQNNNRFDGLCFQVGTHSGTYDWASGTSKTNMYRYASSELYWAFLSATANCGTNAPPASDTVTFSSSSGLMGTFANLTAVNDIQIFLTNSGGLTGAPTGTSTYTWYWIVEASGSTFKLSTTKGGAAIAYTDAGTGTHTVETQEGLQFTDNAGKVWECEGRKARTPWFIKDTGAFSNTMTRCRWEGGTGPFFRVWTDRRFNTSQSNNLCEPYTVSAYTAYANMGDLDSEASIKVDTFPHYNSFKQYTGDNSGGLVIIDDIARRYLQSASGHTIAGMGFVQTADWNTIVQSVATAATTMVLCRDYVRFALSGSWNAVVFVDTSVHKRFAASPDIVSAAQWFVLKAYDKNFQAILNDNYNKTLAVPARFQAGSGGHWDNVSNTSGGIGFSVPNSTVGGLVTGYVAVCVNAHGALALCGVRSLSVSSYDNAVTGLLRVVTPWGSVHNRARFSAGIPIVGILNTVGEYIGNLTSTANNPLGWTVKTAGALAPAYANGVAVIAGELRSDGTNIKAAQAAHTTNGATMADDVTNGNPWDTLYGTAVLEAVLPATKDPTTGVLAGATFAQHALTGAQEVVHINTNATPGTLTTRTAAQMISDQGAGTSGSWKVRIINNSDAGAVLTIGLGSGVTNPLSTTLTIAQDKFGDFLFTITGAGAVTIARVGTGDHV